VGSQRDCTWVLGLPGFCVERIEGQGAVGSGRLHVHVTRRRRRYPSSGCGRQISRVRSTKECTWLISRGRRILSVDLRIFELPSQRPRNSPWRARSS
jgi:hypothetical protein